MDLSLNEEQQILKKTAADFMKQECPKQVLMDLDGADTESARELWRKVANLGWLGMPIPTEYGGGGSSFLDAAVVFEELGKGPLPGPYFSSGLLGAVLILDAGTEDQKREILQAVCQGEQVLTLAVTEPEHRWGPGAVNMTASLANETMALNGTKTFVHDALAATSIICAVRTHSGDGPEHGITLIIVDKRLPGVTVKRHGGFLGQVAEVKLDNVQVPAAAVLGEPGKGWETLGRALERALPILCAYQVGGCESVVNLSLDYSAQRLQFGQPIGRFQRVQDHLINAVNYMDAARWTTYEALWKLDSGRPAASSVHLAKVAAAEAYYLSCNEAHEVHAAIGTSTEYGLVPHTKMSRALYPYLGDPLYHRRRLADALQL